MWWCLPVVQLALLLPSMHASPASHERVNSPVVGKHEVPNANHIFNTIQSSMRQWGSSWNHNGVSFFLATVPQNTQFYHGSPDSSPIRGMEWLAFEPEHALNFAGIMGPPRHDRTRDNDKPQPPPRQQQAHRLSVKNNIEAQAPLHLMEAPFQPPPPPPSGRYETGYLHSYRTKHPLSLLYIDGLSAGKSSIGLLDSQNHVLLNWTSDKANGRGWYAEEQRAEELCQIAATKWKSRVDGFIRMEMGFEIILCDFEEHLEFGEALRATGPDGVSLGPFFRNEIFAWYRSIATRFDGIGYDRVTLNYDDFITAFSYPNIDIFPDGLNSQPRLQNLSLLDLNTMREDVDVLVLSHDLPYHKDSTSTDWQAVTDMIVTRYGTALPFFASLTNTTLLRDQIKLLMRPFIDFSTRNLTTEIDRCTNHFLPTVVPSTAKSRPSTARDAITHISYKICTTLLSTLDLDPTLPTTTEPYKHIQNLTSYLDWPIWRRCTDLCSYDEVCFIPIWPLGTVEDRERGRGECRGPEQWMPPDGQSYWFRPGEEPGPRPRPRPPPRRDGDRDGREFSIV